MGVEKGPLSAVRKKAGDEIWEWESDKTKKIYICEWVTRCLVEFFVDSYSCKSFLIMGIFIEVFETIVSCSKQK